MDKYMKIAFKQAKKAYKKGDVPVGCVIVKDNKIIAQAHNQKEKKHSAIMHAEIIAINKACKKLKTWHLDDCILYSTLEPCMMCCGAIVQSRIKKIVFSLENEKYGCHKLLKNIEIIKDVNSNESKKILNSFFINKRK